MAVVQISTTVNCVSRPKIRTIMKKTTLHTDEPGIWAIAAGNDTKVSVMPERTTSARGTFDWLAIKPKIEKTTRPP